MSKSLASHMLSLADALPEWLLRSFAVAFALLMAILLAATNADGSLEHKLANLRDAVLSKPASGEIHIVEIDAKSISEIDSWPWKRSVHAELVDRLVAAGAQQIVFDVDFSSHSTAAEDRIFADSLARAGGKVVLPTFRQQASHGANSADSENLPIEPLRAHAMLGSVNVQPDRAGQVNRYPYGEITDGIPRPSIAALLADHKGSVANNFEIDQSIDIQTIPRHSFVDILDGRVDPSVFRGKRVLIGATAIELGDRYATARYGVIPGVVIQALAAETLIAGPIAPEAGAWPLLLLAMVAMAMVIRFIPEGGIAAAGAALGASIGCFAMAAALHDYRLVNVEIAPALLLIFGTSLAFLVIRMFRNAALERMIDRETRLPNFHAWRKRAAADCSKGVVVAEMQNLDAILSASKSADVRLFLRTIADRLELSCGTGNLYRIGPERFCWALETDSMEDTNIALEGTASLFNAPLVIGDRTVRVMVCLGVAQDSNAGPVDLVRKAALAAKRAGEFGLRSMRYGEDLAQETDLSLFVVSEFDAALASGQISVVYQPKYCLASNQVTAAEALVRWHHPQKGQISPAIFIPLLEQENLLGPLTLFVIGQTLHDMRQWSSAGQRLRCAINISASLFTDPQFPGQSLALVRQSGIDPGRITFELTETAVLSSLTDPASIWAGFKSAGIELSIDDYGTGQSTLSYLKSFDADEIKIDQSFIRAVGTSQTNRIMVQSTIEMAHALGMKVVAEGVEDAATLAILRDLCCDIVQGWHIGKPVPADEFARLWCDHAKAAERRAGQPRSATA